MVSSIPQCDSPIQSCRDKPVLSRLSAQASQQLCVTLKNEHTNNVTSREEREIAFYIPVTLPQRNAELVEMPNLLLFIIIY